MSVYHPAGPEPRFEGVDLLGLTEALEQKVVGQPGAIRSIVPYVETFHAGLSPANRPAGVFLLLGPTGTGKTRTVEVLAEALHGSDRKLLRVDCGEFQMEHEVARLIGAPPGYLGHRETQPLITQKRLSAAASENSPLNLVLFDEIEKAAPSLSRLLLGVLDKAVLHLGDNTEVDFGNSLVFLTSNLGARGMLREIRPDYGFQSMVPVDRERLAKRLERVGVSALRRRFSPEFVNRIDAVLTYQPLGRESLARILDQQIGEFRQLVRDRFPERAFRLEITEDGMRFLLDQGTSSEYGARELRRTVHRYVIQPVSSKLARGELTPDSHVRLDHDPDNRCLAVMSGPVMEFAPAGARGAKRAGAASRLRLTA